MRGAVDGLNVVVPYGEPNYYDSRPTLAIARAGGDGAVIDLDGFFGLHPALATLEPQWRDGTLAFVHACGSPDPTRSHFDAQDYMESGTPGVKSTGDGWMNRVLAVMPGQASPTEALSLGANVPRILSGRMPVANIALGRGAARPLPMDRPIVETAFDRLYSRQRRAQPRLPGRAHGARQADDRTRTGHDRGQQRRAFAQGILRRHRAPRASDRARPEYPARLPRARRMGHARQPGRRPRASSRTICSRSARGSRVSQPRSGRTTRTPSSWSSPSSDARCARTAMAAPTTATAT